MRLLAVTAAALCACQPPGGSDSPDGSGAGDTTDSDGGDSGDGAEETETETAGDPPPDPACVVWEHSFGDGAANSTVAIATDPEGAAIVVTTHNGENAAFTDVRKYDPDGTVAWITELDSASGDLARGVAVADSGDVYVVGATGGELPGATHLNGWDAFLAKLDPQGNLSWVRQFGASESAHAFGVTVSKEDRVYVTGFFGPDEDVGGADWHIDAFVAEYDANGEQYWLRTYASESAGDETGRDVAVGPDGNVYVLVDARSPLPGAGRDADGVGVLKLDSAGEPLWTRQVEVFGNDYPTHFDVAADGTAFVAGHGSNDLDAGFTFALSTSGDLSWTDAWEPVDTGKVDGRDVALDDAGHVYVIYSGLPDFATGQSAGNFDAVIRKYDADGTILSTQVYGDESRHEPRAIDVVADGDLYVGGFLETVTGPVFVARLCSP